MSESRCLCGDHVWRVDAPLALLHHCHCAMCRKHQGAAYSTLGSVPPEKFAWLARGEAIEYESSPGFLRRSCARCGSPLPSDPGPMGVFVFAGPLEGDPGERPSGHLFAASRLPWLEIEDGLPAYDAYPPGFDAPIQPTPASEDAPGDGVRGSCLCGTVRWRIEGEPTAARHCHCLRCRRARGALHASNLGVPLDGLRVTHGESDVREYRLPDARYFGQSFCGRCGAPVPRRDAERGIAVVPLGALDDDPGLAPTEHIFVDSRAAWFEIPGDLPRHAERPPA